MNPAARRRCHAGFRHLAAVLGHHEAMGQHRVIGCPAAGAAGLQQRGMEPAAMLIGAFEIEGGRRFAGRRGPRARTHGSNRNRTRHRRCRAPAHSPRRRRHSHEEARRVGLANQASPPSASKASAIRSNTAWSRRTIHRSVLWTKTGIGTAPGALARDAPVRPALDHRAQTGLAPGWARNRVSLDRRSGLSRAGHSSPWR